MQLLEMEIMALVSVVCERECLHLPSDVTEQNFQMFAAGFSLRPDQSLLPSSRRCSVRVLRALQRGVQSRGRGWKNIAASPPYEMKHILVALN